MTDCEPQQNQARKNNRRWRLSIRRRFNAVVSPSLKEAKDENDKASAPSADYFSNNHVLVNLTRHHHQSVLQQRADRLHTIYQHSIPGNKPGAPPAAEIKRRYNEWQTAQASVKVPPLQRSRALDTLAYQHVQFVASTGKLLPVAPNVQTLQAALSSAYVGENVLRGRSVRSMHDRTTSEMALHAMWKVAASAKRSKHDSRRISAEETVLAAQLSNIVNPTFVEMGMATARSPVDGKLYMVQLFRGVPGVPQSKN
jgi:uncharacterized protein YkwD